jgi:hypothetical protein
MLGVHESMKSASPMGDNETRRHATVKKLYALSKGSGPSAERLTDLSLDPVWAHGEVRR